MAFGPMTISVFNGVRSYDHYLWAVSSGLLDIFRLPILDQLLQTTILILLIGDWREDRHIMQSDGPQVSRLKKKCYSFKIVQSDAGCRGIFQNGSRTVVVVSIDYYLSCRLPFSRRTP